MRCATMLAVLTLIVTAGAVNAQDRIERVLLDSELWMGNGAEQRLCQSIPPGDLTITASITRTLIVPSTVALRLYSLTGAMNGESFEMAVGTDPSTLRASLNGGPYCWAVEASSYAHNTGEPFVAIRMTLAPR